MTDTEKRYEYTPIGTAIYPYLRTFDTYKNQNRYKVTLLFDEESEEWIDFKSKIDTMVDNGYEHAIRTGEIKQEDLDAGRVNKVYPYKEHHNKEGESTGLVEIRFNMKNQYVKNGEIIELKPRIFDENMEDIPEDVQIGYGSKMKVRYYMFYYYIKVGRNNFEYGVSPKLVSVQVTELKEFKQSPSKGYTKKEG